MPIKIQEETELVRKQRSTDLYFILAGSLVSLIFLFAIVIPKVHANWQTRRELDQMITETKDLFEKSRKVEKLRWALETEDPWVLSEFRREHLPLYGQQGAGAGENRRVEHDAGHSQSK